MRPRPAPGAVIFSVTYIGDLALATLGFDAIAPRLSGSLELVTSPQAAPLVAADPRLRRVRQVRSSSPLVWRAEVARYVREAWRERALVVNFEVHPPRWRFLRHLCGLAGVESWSIDLPGLVEDNRRSALSEVTLLPHRSHYYARAVGLSGAEPPPPRVVVAPEAGAGVAARLAALAVGDRRIVVVHPGSTEARRRAPVGLFTGILDGLANRCPILPVLVGSESELELCDAIENALAEPCVNWAAGLTLPELAALLRAADLFIGNDSGPLKIAEAVQARTLSLWGPTQSGFAGPRGPSHRTLRFDDPPAEGVGMGLELLEPERAKRLAIER